MPPQFVSEQTPGVAGQLPEPGQAAPQGYEMPQVQSHQIQDSQPSYANAIVYGFSRDVEAGAALTNPALATLFPSPQGAAETRTDMSQLPSH